MNAVLDHIDRHLDAPLDLAVLAAVAHYSPFHFHRLFAAWLGESAAAYVTRRRLEVGALSLASYPALNVTEVAQQVGFGSPEAFARAFKRHFGLTPSAWQRDTPQRWEALREARRLQDRKLDQAPSPGPGHHASSFNEELVMMKVTVHTLPPVRVAYFRRLGAYGPQIGQFWEELVRPWIQSQGLESAWCYGVGWDDPQLTPPGKCRYDACIELPPGFALPGAVSVQELPGGRYAMAAFEGTGAELAQAWRWLLTDWFPRSGHQLDMRPFFERLSAAARPDPQTGAFACELCLPIQRP